MGGKIDIHDRIFAFVLDVLKAVTLIPTTVENNVLIRQLVRSVGSIGANAAEADGAQTKKDFIHKFSISKKEAKESHYWLRLIADHNKNIKNKFLTLIDENGQITAIISTIIKNAKMRK